MWKFLRPNLLLGPVTASQFPDSNSPFIWIRNSWEVRLAFLSFCLGKDGVSRVIVFIFWLSRICCLRLCVIRDALPSDTGSDGFTISLCMPFSCWPKYTVLIISFSAILKEPLQRTWNSRSSIAGALGTARKYTAVPAIPPLVIFVFADFLSLILSYQEPLSHCSRVLSPWLVKTKLSSLTIVLVPFSSKPYARDVNIEFMTSAWTV